MSDPSLLPRASVPRERERWKAGKETQPAQRSHCSVPRAHPQHRPVPPASRGLRGWRTGGPSPSLSRTQPQGFSAADGRETSCRNHCRNHPPSRQKQRPTIQNSGSPDTHSILNSHAQHFKHHCHTSKEKPGRTMVIVSWGEVCRKWQKSMFSGLFLKHCTARNHGKNSQYQSLLPPHFSLYTSNLSLIFSYFCTSLSTSLPLFLPASFSLSLCLSPSQHIYLSVCLSIYLNLKISLILSHISSGNLIGQNSILLTWVISETNQPCQVHIGSNSKGVWEHSEASGALTGLPWLVPAQGQVYPQRRRDRVRLNSKPTCILPDLPGACLATSNK